MKKAFFPGSFNPPTLGHLDLIRRAASLCDHLYVGIVRNESKPKALFTEEERQLLLKTATHGIANVEIVIFSGLVIDFAKQNNVQCLIRGLRTTDDFGFEASMAGINRQMNGIETLFLTAAPQYTHLSSTLIREIGTGGHRLTGLVPEEIEKTIFEKLNKSCN